MNYSAETFNLIGQQLPTIPVPHDCVIKKITLNDDWLILSFEDDLSYHESIKCIHPNARTLTMKFHLIGEPYLELYAYEQRKYENVYVQRKTKKIFTIVKEGRKLEYIGHYVAFGAMKIELCADRPYFIELQTDDIVFEWIEQ